MMTLFLAAVYEIMSETGIVSYYFQDQPFQTSLILKDSNQKIKFLLFIMFIFGKLPVFHLI